MSDNNSREKLVPEAKYQLIVDGDDFFRKNVEVIDNARQEILFETYIFNMDEIGTMILEALQKAVQRGVSVYLLLDGIGSALNHANIKEYCDSNKIPVRFFHPIPRGKFGWISFEIRRWIKFFSAFNNRDHRKVTMVDQTHIFIGSFNVTNVHSKKYQGAQAWRDTAVELLCSPFDPDLHRLRKAFFKAWNRSRPKRFLRFQVPRLHFRKRSKNSGWLRLNDQIALRMSLTRDLRKRFRAATQRIFITNAYFLPRRTLISAMRKAARRNVRVCLCLPAKTDVWFVREASRSLFRRLLKDGVEIYEYQPSVLHAKCMIIDDWAAVGSYNLNHRSFLHDLEVEVGSRNVQFVSQVYAAWTSDLKKTKEITLTDLNTDSIFRRWLSRTLFLLRYFL